MDRIESLSDVIKARTSVEGLDFCEATTQKVIGKGFAPCPSSDNQKGCTEQCTDSPKKLKWPRNCWLSKRSVQLLQEKLDYESSTVKNMYDCLLESEKNAQQKLNSYLESNLRGRMQKRDALFKRWQETIYNPLLKQIKQEMNGGKFKSFYLLKEALYGEYLDHCNKKGHVFLDVISTDDYDPMILNGHRPGPLKVTTPTLDVDPLLQLRSKKTEEDRTLLACDHGRKLTSEEIERLRLPALPLVPLGRHGCTCASWLEMKLTDIQSGVRLRSQAKVYGIRNLSSAPLHEITEKGLVPEVFDRKNRWLKKRQFPNRKEASVLFL